MPKDNTTFSNPYINNEASKCPNIENKKLLFLKRIEREIANEITPISKKIPVENESNIKRFFRKLNYHFMTILGPIVNLAGGYLFASSLFLLIPGISHLVVIILVALYLILNSVLHYAFDVTLFKKSLPEAEDPKGLLDCYIKQIELTNSINQFLSTAKFLTIDNALYKKYIKLAILFNEDIKKKKNHIKSYHESIPKKTLKWGMVAFGILANTAASYFFTRTFFSVVYPPLLGSPLGLFLISLMIALKLVYFYATQARSMMDLVNPDREKFQILTKKFKELIPKEVKDFDSIDSMRRTVERGRLLLTSEIQTPPIKMRSCSDLANPDYLLRPITNDADIIPNAPSAFNLLGGPTRRIDNNHDPKPTITTQKNRDLSSAENDELENEATVINMLKPA